MDVVALFPYLLWALDEAIYENRHGLFAFWVAVNLLNNYFFFVGQVIFLCIYFVCKLTAKDFRLTGRKFGHLLWESVLGVAMGCLLLFPAVLSLLQNPRTIDLSSGWGFLTYAKVQQYLAILLSWILPPDSPYLTSVWSEGVIKWTSMTAYLPLCSLAGAMAYWRSRKADSKKRIVAVCAVCALVPVLNSAFYALNSSYYARWYYMPSLILAAMTVNALEDPDVDLDAPARGIGWIMLATLVFAVVPVRDDTTGTWSFGVLKNPEQFFVVLGFGLLGLMLYRYLCGIWRQNSRFAQRMTAAVLVFACVFSMVHIGIGKFGQWHTDSDLVEQDTNALQLKNDLPKGDYRIDTYKIHDNIGMWLDKSCLQYFGSTAAPSILSFYPGLGVKRDVRSEPEITNYALRGLLSVEYLITTPEKRESFEDEADAGWTYLADVDGYTLYHNDNYVPMGFTYDYYVTKATYEASVKTLRSNLLLRALVLDPCGLRHQQMRQRMGHPALRLPLLAPGGDPDAQRRLGRGRGPGWGLGGRTAEPHPAGSLPLLHHAGHCPGDGRISPFEAGLRDGGPLRPVLSPPPLPALPGHRPGDWVLRWIFRSRSGHLPHAGLYQPLQVRSAYRLRQHQGGQRRLQRRLPGHLCPGGRVSNCKVSINAVGEIFPGLNRK